MSDCYLNYNNVELVFNRYPDNCSVCKKNESTSIERWIPYSVCPALLHTAYAYFYTFFRGGKFAWLKDRNLVDFQCPRPESGVVAALYKKQTKIILELLSSGQCIRETKGRKIELLMIHGNFCYKAFDAIFPYLNRVASESITGTDFQINASCPGCDLGRSSCLLRISSNHHV